MTFSPSALRRGRRRLGGLVDVLRHWPWFDTLRTLRQRLREDHLALTASSLTFTTLISLVPLVTVMLAIFTAFPIFARFQTALQQYFLQALVPDNIARPVLQALTQFAGKANKLGSVGLVLLGITALALMFTIDRTLNGIWRVPRPRPLAQRVLVYWAALTLGPLLLGASLSLTSYALSASRGLVDALPGAVALLIDALEFGLLAAGVATLFRCMPNTHVRWAHAWAGAVFVAIGFEVAKRALGWYVQSVPGYSVVYGAFATVPIFLLWIYLSWLIVLLGAVIAAYAPSLAMRVATTMLMTPSYNNTVAGGTTLNLPGGLGAVAATLAPEMAIAGYAAQADAIEEALGVMVGAGFAPLVALGVSSQFGLAYVGLYLLSGAVCSQSADTAGTVRSRASMPVASTPRAIRRASSRVAPWRL